MIVRIATTPEQSQRLIACGVNPESADMSYTSEKDSPLTVVPYKRQWIPNKQPAWSLSALLALLPKHLDDFPQTKWRPPFLEDEIWEMDNEGVLNGDVKLYSNGTNWIVGYDWDGFSGTLPQSENPIEAVVLAIELLHANGYTFNTK